MNRVTIDYGIDLGTTNSEICVLSGIKPDPIRNNLNSAITPSAVHINKRGEIIVGARAKEALEDYDLSSDAHIEFKRRIGTDYTYKFKTSGKAMSPTELSSEVLKSLRGDVQQQLGEIINAAVITVPAAFTQRQCAATRDAAELAGFVQSPLLQEPVAAALAYGFQAEMQKEYWLVFDFGGGTFDAALIKAEDGTITVVNHDGDNFLGGADIDWAIFNQLVLPKIQDEFNIDGFARGAEQWKTQLAIVKGAIEKAKVALSRSEKAFLEDCVIKDLDGNECEVVLEISKNQVIDIAEPIILRAVALCNKVMSEKNLNSSAIEKMILVGGPTLAPYFRDILKSKLNIPIDHSVDPMTVVAQGAAIFARGQRLDEKSAPKAAVGQFSIRLTYNPIGADEDPKIKGKVESTDGTATDGYVIEFVQKKSGWRSGKVPLKAGSFTAILLAEKGYSNEFGIELYDSTGVKHKTVPDMVVYTIGATATEQILPVTIPIALADNGTVNVFKKGDPLPNKTSLTRVNTKTVKRGDPTSKLVIPLVEGENPRADRNKRLGALEISGDRIPRDLPAGADVELVVSIDASRIIRVKAYIPVLDEEYEAKIDYTSTTPSQSWLEDEYRGQVERLSQLTDKAEEHEKNEISQMVDDAQAQAESVEGLIADAGDPDAAQQAETRLLELKVKLDQAEDALRFPEILKDTESQLEKLRELVDKSGTAAQKHQVATWQSSLETITKENDTDKLKRLQDKMTDLHREFLREDPEFWGGFLAYLYSRREHMRDQNAAERMFEIGARHMENKNVQGMMGAVQQLLQLLPPEEAAAAQGGYGSTIQ